MTPRPLRLILLLAAAVVGLSACGRRGPLELPPDVQARGAALRAQQEAALAKTGPKPAPGQAVPAPPPPPIPGTIGNRPPEDYPFPLDPLL
ncbi:LPS translocon maturation chaperone LptM [Methylocystis echinoides]|uniref:LPS translocon maturation chaperone LptM n=1 Tax=Methylocystis echinoides TaxID=29468 RepID=UPI00343849DA